VPPEYVRLPFGVRAFVAAPDSLAYRPRPGHVVIGFGRIEVRPHAGWLEDRLRRDSQAGGADSPIVFVREADGRKKIVAVYPVRELVNPGWHVEIARENGGSRDGLARLRLFPNADFGGFAREHESRLGTVDTGLVFDPRSSQGLLDFLLGQTAPQTV
jgi:hypothetical protein